MTQYYGKYRGKVENNIDPMQQGRLMVSVPAVTGTGTLNWAMPCAPFAGSGVGLWAIPPVGANVWVEYEGGDPDYPIWSGCFWGVGEAPALPALPQVVVLKTETCTLTLNDLPGVGGVTIEMATGAKIAMTATGIEINNGMGATITLQGPQVTVNNGALEVI
ncbi:MAG: phage baseplate assembly protein V [Anaerolineae bacterium]